MTIHKSAKIYKDVILVETSLEDNTFVTKNLPSTNEAFGSNFNDSDDDSDVPF